MRASAQALSLALLLAGGASLAARPAQAVNYWPTGTPYACTWSKPNPATGAIDHGVSIVQFLGMVGAGQFGADFQRAGTLQTTYASGGTPNSVGVNLWWDWPIGENQFLLATSTNIQCRLRTSNLGHTLIFDLCNNGAVQNCSQ